MRLQGFGPTRSERGITGLETAIILIAFVVVASVFAFTVLSTGVFSSERSKETIYAGLQEAKSSLEPRGSVIAYTGTDAAGEDTVYKVSFVVANAVAGEAIDMTPPYTADESATDPDESVGAEYRTVISYTDSNQYLADVPWSVNFVGNSSGDFLLEDGEKAEVTVWLLERDTTTAINATGAVDVYSGPGGSGAHGITDANNVLTPNDQFTIEVKPSVGAVVTLQRVVPVRLDTVMDLK